MNKKNTCNKGSTWADLVNKASQPLDLNQLFSEQSNRTSQFSASACGIYLDFSKQLLDTVAFETLLTLAKDCGLAQKITALTQGGIVNPTENRAALHTALRLPASATLLVDGKNINQDIEASLSKAAVMVEKIRGKVWRGFSGKAITDVVNIGVGGSDLGPLMTATALEEWATSGINIHFASSIDGTQLAQRLKTLSPETTLFIVSSKSFSTIDTMSNAKTALAWLLQGCDDEAVVKQNHFIGVSASPQKMMAWGISEAHQLLFWEWVGGRFSMWSAIGLSIAIKLGMPHFRALLAGAHAMDSHFQQADFAQNLPVILGLLGVWNSTFLGINAHSVLPYDGRLKYFPNYLTQLEMESNGKSVTLDGESVDYATCPILWGEVGSNAQHAFYQLLHQGTQRVACDFIAPIARYGGEQAIDDSLVVQHQLALANCLAQSRVLAFGNRAVDDGAQQRTANNTTQNPHKRYRGNQPSSTILLDELTPYSLGALVALYEHKVFVMSVLWHINPFDQWGVEIGKVMASTLGEAITQKQCTGFDDSTNALLAKISQASTACADNTNNSSKNKQKQNKQGGVA